MAAIIIIALVVIAASSGAVFKPGEWYDKLDKPGWTPPDWAFPVVWTILYAMIAYSGWLAWHSAAPAAIALWCLQLVFNAAWSWLFFGRKRMDLAFFDVCLLLGTILLYMAVTVSTSALAALLFVPYAVWVTTAAALNWQVWRLNPSAAH